MPVATLVTIAEALQFAIRVLNLILLVYIVIGWLRVFNVGFAFNPVVGQIYVGLHSVLDPILSLIRRVIPTRYGGIDISPIVLLGGLWLLQTFVRTWARQIMLG
ncbi:MAG: YggT family protein [Alphaproteobacteria bacterium]|nr:YggT family protein [Alphaproteobacteria bacterium]